MSNIHQHRSGFRHHAQVSMFGEATPQAPKTGIVCDASCLPFVKSKYIHGYFHGMVEWQAVDLETGELVVTSYVQPRSTSVIGEFMGIVNALQYLNDHGDYATPVYSDSQIAVRWVNERYTATKLPRNFFTMKALNDLDDALLWLKEVAPTNPVRWWRKEWGESPADFGRK